MIKNYKIIVLLLTILFIGCSKDGENQTSAQTQAVVSSLDCSNATINGVLSNNNTTIIQGVALNNVELKLNYSGGNGGNYSAISITSTGVTGLTATAVAGTVSNDNGTITLLINGTPMTTGNALFNINLGGINCEFVVKVNSNVVQATMTQNYFTTTNDGSLGYWLYTPQNPTPNMPLIVYLHGGSGRGTDLALVVSGSLPKFINENTITNIPAYVLMPQCPANKVWEQIAVSVNEIIDNVVATKNINSNKISLTGHSLGGTGTWKLGALYSNKFSCIAPLSGSVTTSTASSYINIPVWAFVGSADTTVSPTSSTTIVPMINSAGGNAQIKVYSGATHFDVPDLTYNDTSVNLLTWLISNTL